MVNERMLLTENQLMALSSALIEKLHAIPLYDVEAKRRLALQCIEITQSLIMENIKDLADANPNAGIELVLSRAAVDRLTDG